MKANYPKICNNLLKALPDRTKEVLERRFGFVSAERETLESIGKSFDVTRERVRQIEEDGFARLKELKGEYQAVLADFSGQLRECGNLKKEDSLLQMLGGDKFQNHVLFLMTLGNQFEKVSETRDFYPFWTTSRESTDLARKVVNIFINKFEEKKQILPAGDIYKFYKKEVDGLVGKSLKPEALASYVEISKQIKVNPDGNVGLKTWAEISPRGVKDRAYLSMKKAGKPLHFREVAGNLGAFSATVHNELIKDPRFVLVGRGLYALAEWGYTPGVVKDVIANVLRTSSKPLTKEEIVKNVMQQRIVKENTILLNLQNRKNFQKNAEGRYTVREA